MENSGLNDYIYKFLYLMNHIYTKTSNKNLVLDDSFFKDYYEYYCDMKQINTDKTILSSNNKFKRFCKKNDIFKLCMINNKENYTYGIYIKSNGFYKWRLNKRNYSCFKNIIKHLEEEYKYNNDDNFLINIFDETI